MRWAGGHGDAGPPQRHRCPDTDELRKCHRQFENCVMNGDIVPSCDQTPDRTGGSEAQQARSCGVVPLKVAAGILCSGSQLEGRTRGCLLRTTRPDSGLEGQESQGLVSGHHPAPSVP